ncbi:MAG: thiamine diphosphokinase, partial [Ignavibacteriaceae bacterium]|nr:thiamine diphosphokinase [Ignavibacteriaceae bacterium]
KFFDKIRISLVSEKSFLIPINRTTYFKSRVGETISLYAFDNKTKITTTGLKYKLINTALPFGVKESTSNVAIQNNIKIKVTGGIVFVIRDYNFMKKYDLF